MPPLNIFSFARGMSMLIGRYQSSAFHLFELLDAYAIPEFLNYRRDRVFVSVNGHPSLLAFVKYDMSADVRGWSNGAGAEELASAALTLLHDEGIRYANILLTAEDYNLTAEKIDTAIKGSRGSLLRVMKK
jgi:hypothetical protein